jgi:serine protease Do
MTVKQHIIASLLLAGLLTAGTGTGTETECTADDLALLKRASRAFSDVAKQAIPAVVFIQVEKVVEVGGGAQGPYLNDPFNFFGDDFLERFFGGRPQRGAPQRRRQVMGQGSGFLISKDGYILTNNHVVGDADRILVTLHDGREFTATRIGSDPKSEVAVIRIEGDDFPFVGLGDSDALEIGEWVIAIGNPFGLSETLTVGVVSAKGRSNIGIAEYEDFIQTDAAINPGNSGGPMLSLDGKVVGINTAIYSQSGGYMGIGFAVPINMARAIKDQLVATGSVVRGFLGIQLNPQEMDEDLAASFGLPRTGGVLVAEVIPDSPADRAGLLAGDIILELAGEPVSNSGAFRNRVALLEPETQVELRVFRNGKEIDLNVTIGTLSGDGVALGAERTAETIGLAVQDLNAELARRFGFDYDQGVIITGVEPGSAAARAGLRPGFVITAVNDSAVLNTQDFYDALAAARPAGLVRFRVKSQRYTWYVVIRLD